MLLTLRLCYNDLALRCEIADARLRAESRIRSLDAHPAKTSVARFVQRREVKRVLVSQLIRYFRISRFKRIKRERLVQLAAGCLRELGQVLFTLVQYLNPSRKRSMFTC